MFFTFLKPYNTSKTQKYFQVGKNVKIEYCYLPILSMEAKLSAKSAIAGWPARLHILQVRSDEHEAR